MKEQDNHGDSEFRDVRRLLKSLPKLNAPDDMFERVSARLAGDKQPKKTGMVLSLLTRPSVITSAAASIVILISVVFLFRRGEENKELFEIAKAENEIIVYYVRNSGATAKAKFATARIADASNPASRRKKRFGAEGDAVPSAGAVRTVITPAESQEANQPPASDRLSPAPAAPVYEKLETGKRQPAIPQKGNDTLKKPR